MMNFMCLTAHDFQGIPILTGVTVGFLMQNYIVSPPVYRKMETLNFMKLCVLGKANAVVLGS